MLIEETDYDTYRRIVRPGIFFNTPEFNRLNSAKADRVRFLLFRDKKYRFGLIVGERGGGLFAPFSAPFASFVSVRSKWELLQLDEAVRAFDEFAAGFGRVRFTLPPHIYGDTLIASLQNALLRRGYAVLRQELNFSIDLEKMTGDAYSAFLPPNGRKNLTHAMSAKLSLVLCETLADKKKAYDVIAVNRRWKGYPLRMTWEEVATTIELVPHELFIVSRGGESLAAAVVFRVTERIAQVVYWGDVPGASDARPVNFLAYSLVRYYAKAGMKILDIGPSTEDGEPNYGLCDFKRSVGCEANAKFVMEKE